MAAVKSTLSGVSPPISTLAPVPAIAAGTVRSRSTCRRCSVRRDCGEVVG